jgi:hypothetical protein
MCEDFPDRVPQDFPSDLHRIDHRVFHSPGTDLCPAKKDETAARP